jgi:hypothetical protein
VSFALPDHRPQRIGVEATAVIQLVHRPDVISLTRGRALRKGCNAAVIRDPLELVTLRQRVPSQSLDGTGARTLERNRQDALT